MGENISSVSLEDAQPRTATILNFWFALSIILILFILACASGPVALFIWLVTSCVLSFLRHRFRQAFKMDDSACACFQDCLLFSCCCYCLIAQDSRHIEQARLLKHPAVVNV